MSWYNPLHWFSVEKKGEKESAIELYCSNPQCEERIINEDEIAYNEKSQEIYHDSLCAEFALVHKVFQSRGMLHANIDYISRKRALELIRKGKIKQESLEQKVK